MWLQKWCCDGSRGAVQAATKLIQHPKALPVAPLDEATRALPCAELLKGDAQVLKGGQQAAERGSTGCAGVALAELCCQRICQELKPMLRSASFKNEHG